MSCSIITIVTSRGNGGSMVADRIALVVGQAGERLVQQQHLRLLGERHGQLETPPLAIGRFRHKAVPAIGEAHLAEGFGRQIEQIGATGQQCAKKSQRSARNPSSERTTLCRRVSCGNRVRIW